MSVQPVASASRDRWTEVLLENGDRMDRKTFHALYEQTPPGFRAELIRGVVYVASPTKFRHGRPHTWIVGWLTRYAAETPGTDPLLETTHLLDDDNEPEPDAVLRLMEEYGGQSTETADGYISGPPELVVEVANSSAAIDLHDKRAAYEEAGVREYLVVVTRARRVVWHARGRGGFTELRPAPDGVFRSRLFPGLWLDPVALFPLDRRRLMDTLIAGLASAEHAAFVAKLEARAARRKSKGGTP